MGRWSALGILGAFLIAAGCSTPSRSPAEFSVVLVTLDTTRADRVGSFGGDASLTPHLDAAAAEGVKFSAAISQVPLTLPAHGSIFTGRYPSSHGVRHNGIYKLAESEDTLAERMSAEGFDTAGFVAAFVLNEGFGAEQGFTTYDDIETARYEGGRDSLYEARRSAEEVNASVFRWLDEREPGRFFLWIHYYDPHHPYVAPEREGLSGSGYDRTVSYMDAGFGDLVARLTADGILDDTLLVVVGDHGESLGEHREVTHGVFLYEGAVRVPFFVRAPGLVPEGTTVEGPVEIVDVAPTILDLLDLPALDNADGVSLVDRFGGGRAADAVAYAETFMPRIEFGWSELRMVRTGRFKFIDAPRPELYDLREDPKELENLVEIESERVQEMAARLAEWVERTTDHEAAGRAARAISPEEEAKLRSLGYLSGGEIGSTAGDGRTLPDPKDKIGEGLRVAEAREKLAAGRPEEALPILDAVLADSPANHLARSSRIQALVRLKRLNEAEDDALAAVAAAVSDPASSSVLLEKARRTLASIYWMVGKNDLAEEEYRKAIDLNQANDSAAMFGGLLLGAAGGAEEAMRIVEDVLSRNPKDPMALAARFELEHAKDDEEAALRTARLLAEIAAGDADTLVKAGVLARKHKDPVLAVPLFRAAADKKPDDPDILGYLGTAKLAAGDLAGAEEALRAVRRLRPDDARAPFYLGNIALLRDREQEARLFMDEATRLDENFLSPQLNLARWLGDKGRFDEALATVAEVLERAPDNASARDLDRQIRSLAGGT